MCPKSSFLSSLVFVFAVGIWGVFLIDDAVAQVRPAYVRDLDTVARQTVTIRKNTSVSIFEDVYTVPAGKKLVVEHMNCSALGTAPLYVRIFEGSLAHAKIVSSLPSVGTNASVRILEGQMRLYIGPGETVFLRIFTTDNTTCTFSGHTVDANP
jgi:hypothetical protein